MDFSYGKYKHTQQLDDEGSYKETEIIMRDGVAVNPSTEYTEIREKVKGDLSAMVVTNTLLEEIKNMPDNVSAGYRIEGYNQKDEKGYYYVVKCYTRKVRAK